MIVGFTGTRKDLVGNQLVILNSLFPEEVDIVLHGGADVLFVLMVKQKYTLCA